MNAGLRTTVHLIRHADAIPEAASPADGAGDYDTLGLSSAGIAQSKALARRIAAGRFRPAALYASPTRRAYQTATILAESLGLDVAVDARFREIFLGKLGADAATVSGRGNAIRTRLAELAAIAVRDGSWHAVPDSEPAAEARARMTAAVDSVIGRHRGTHVAIVSHAGSINAYFAGLVGTARDFFFLAGNTSLSSVAFSDGAVSLIRLNDTAHLESLAKPPTTSSL